MSIPRLTKLRKYWGELHERLELDRDCSWLFQDIVNCYNDELRFYHNLDHLLEGLEELQQARRLLAYTPTVEMAWWFHDTIYVPANLDNEFQSGEFAGRCLTQTSYPPESIQRVKDLIGGTTHAAETKDPELQLLLDVDLTILGQEEARFDAYEVGVRKEYAHLSKREFAEGRKRILEVFLGRKHLYTTKFFRAKYETAARQNLNRSIRRLDKILGVK